MVASQCRRSAEDAMRGACVSIAAGAGLLLAFAAGPVEAQKRGGVLRMYSPDSPASMSLHEEVTVFAQGPMMGVFNNLVIFDQQARQSSLSTIVPDLAREWAWNEDGTALTFTLRQGVRWHDGQPFTAKDVVCTWDLLLDRAPEKLRANPRRTTYDNLDSVSANGDYDVTFHLKWPQPAFPMLLAHGFTAIYPCHVSPARMRQHPIGTGPFKFVEYKPNEHIKVTRNPDYWKPGRPYLDGIEYTIIRSPATAVLAFVSGNVDMTFPNQLTMPLLKEVRSQMPRAMCEVTPDGGLNRHLIINREKPPFDNPDLRRAMALAIDRKAFVDILTEGQGDIGGVLQPPPGGLWGMPPERLRELPGYDPDVQKSRAQARQIMEKLGYGVDNRLKVKLSTRDIPPYRDPAVLLTDQLKEVYIDAELELVETAAYFPKIRRKDFMVALNLQTSGPDPDPTLALFYGCSSTLNWDGYCNAEVDRLIQRQSIEADEAKRKELVWEIEHRLAEESARPIIFYTRSATCWQPYVKGLKLMANSVYNANRREDWWLDK
jgi:peptide/nickel transport system substrate-binding protein